MNRFALAVPIFLLAGACSEDRSRDSGPARDATVRDDATSNPDAETTPPDSGVEGDAGSTRDPNCPQAARWITTVEGTVTDENGAPLNGSKAQLCVRTAPNGVLLCLRPGDTGGDGRFHIDVSMNARCVTYATMRLLHPTEDRGVSYCRLDLSGGAEALSVATPYKLYPTTRATVLPPLGEPMTQRTVRFAGGLEMDIVPNNYFAGSGVLATEYPRLAAGAVPTASADTCILAGEPRFDGIYAFSQEGDVTMGRALLRMPNTAGLAANARVKIFALGGLACTLDDGSIIPEGRWAEIETAMVSADGMTIPVTPGIPCLSWVAYRAE